MQRFSRTRLDVIILACDLEPRTRDCMKGETLHPPVVATPTPRWMNELALPSRIDPPSICRPTILGSPASGVMRERVLVSHNFNVSEWRLCDDVQPPCLVFSIGVGNFWQFDLAAAYRGCEVHSFDPTPELLKHHKRNVAIYRANGLNMTFHYLGLGATRENISSSYGRLTLGPVAHLGELIRTYARGRPIDVLKIDCEGCEWESFSYLAQHDPTALCSVTGMVQIELHISTKLRFRNVSAARHLFRHLQIEHGFRTVSSVVSAGLDSDRGVDRSLLNSPEWRLASGPGAELDSQACCAMVHMIRTPQRSSLCLPVPIT